MEHETGTPESPADVVGQGSQAVQGAPGSARARRTATVATGVVIAVAAGGAAWAASGTDGATASPSAASPDASPSASPGEDRTPTYGEGRGRFGGGGPHGRGLGGVLHGEAVVPDGEAYREVAFQRGTVSAVGPTSLTVNSEDGFSRTYVLDDETVVDGTAGDSSSLAEGDAVRVLADLDGEVATATSVQERDLAGPDGAAGKDRGEGHGWGRRGWHGRDDSTGGGTGDGTEGGTEGSASALTGQGTVSRA